MTRATLLRALCALAVLAISVVLVLSLSPRLGLDLRGGTQIVLETRDSPTVEADREATDRTLEVLRRRVDGLGVAEPNITRSGDRRIIVELPGLQDPREAADVLGRTAQLSFHPVVGLAGPEGEEPADDEKDAKDAEDGKSAEDADKTADKAADKTADKSAGDADKTADKDADKPADKPADKADSQDGDDDSLILPDESGQRLRLGPAALTGAEVDEAQPDIDTQRGSGWFVTIDLRGPGEKKWADLTGKAACSPPGDPTRRVAIVLDDEVISSPQVDPSVRCDVGIRGGSTQITGDFSQQEARELALLINGGSLPVPVETVEQRTVGPTLGARAIEASAWAAVIGTILTALFIIWIYRLLGLLAVIALACYGLISYGALLGIGATLTLPGLAGFVLTIGMAVDANVLVFERAREEYAGNGSKGRKTLRSALNAGFRNAFSAIADSNITTLLAGGLLFFLASGPVKGFGVTLSIGVIASMVSALLITRVLAEWAVGRKLVQRRPKLWGAAESGRVRLWLNRRSPDLMRHRRRWLAASLIAVVLAGSGVAVRGLQLGVEFTGGRLVEYATTQPVDPEEAREAVADAGFPRAVVQTSGDSELTVRTEKLSNQQEVEVREAIGELGGGAEKVRDELIGPSLGDELRRNALIALAVALAAQMAYLAIRFRWTFGAAAVAAMAHDVIVLLGIFAWLGKPIDGVFLAALLTVIGYSVNDSVVVFDRVRELWNAKPKADFGKLTNTALLQTVPRTVNTGMGALFILTALAVLGGDSLTDFALALLIGIVVGTWSSVFTASPLAIVLQARTGDGPHGRRPQGGTKGGRPKRDRPGWEPGDSGARV